MCLQTVTNTCVSHTIALEDAFLTMKNRCTVVYLDLIQNTLSRCCKHLINLRLEIVAERRHYLVLVTSDKVTVPVKMLEGIRRQTTD